MDKKQPAEQQATCTNSDSWNCKYCNKTKTCAALAAGQATAPQPSPAAQGDAIEHELAMLIRRIVSSARRNCQDESNVLKLANEAWAYLVRKGLVGSPLRDAGIESDVAPQAADSVLEDAARYRLLRRGRHWSVIDGIGNDLLRAEALDAAVDAARKQGGAT